MADNPIIGRRAFWIQEDMGDRHVEQVTIIGAPAFVQPASEHGGMFMVPCVTDSGYGAACGLSDLTFAADDQPATDPEASALYVQRLEVALKCESGVGVPPREIEEAFPDFQDGETYTERLLRFYHEEVAR